MVENIGRLATVATAKIFQRIFCKASQCGIALATKPWKFFCEFQQDVSTTKVFHREWFALYVAIYMHT